MRMRMRMRVALDSLLPRFALMMGRVLPLQCNLVASQRLRRMSQIYSLYSRIYSARSADFFVNQFLNHLRSRLQSAFIDGLRARRPGSFRFILSAATVYFWEQERVTNEEMDQTVDEFWRAFRSSSVSPPARAQNSNGSVQASSDEDVDDQVQEDKWQPIVLKDSYQVWRKAVPSSSLYKYKVFGTFRDIPARAFFTVQMDTEYRKSWDKLVIKLEVVDKEEEGNGENWERDQGSNRTKNYDSKSEVLHWVMHYPFPLYSRDYCYVRRAKIDKRRNLMILVSRATEHPECPPSKSHVRVTDYESRMVIKPHHTFDENGFDYLLTYFDDPKAAFPSPAYNWMACSGVPEFVERLHEAAFNLQFKGRRASKSKPVSQDFSNQQASRQYAYG